MTQKHTPVPWDIAAHMTYTIADAQGRVIASTRTLSFLNTEEAISNARFIVQAVNAHEDLLAALERLLPEEEWSRLGETNDGSIICWVCVNTQAEGHAVDCKIGLARAAIAKASPQAHLT